MPDRIPSLSPADIEFVQEFVRSRSAIALGPDKSSMVRSRLLQLARREGCGSASDLMARLRRDPSGPLGQRVVEALTTHETSFFRDESPFDALREVVIPDLVRRRAVARRLRIWCAACSTGQEPYSIALMLKESFPGLASWDVRLIATDLSSEALQKAISGRFTRMEVHKGLPASLRARYLEPAGADWQVKPEIRRSIEFRRVNLAGPWTAMPHQDVVFLRNVMIYFDRQTQREILGRIRLTLRPDGYLFLGGAETTLGIDDQFERVQLGRGHAYRIRGGL